MNNPEAEQSELDVALAKLRFLPDFQLFTEFVMSEREAYIQGQYEMTAPEMVMKSSGSVVAMDFLLATMTGIPNHKACANAQKLRLEVD